ncbi:MAG TPA: DNA repair and recombination protein RadB [Candidatus Nanoarchaeia archaeon]|nr:DNA repair and recombination protein RadB [Candidatus Nanoarchaeia archaeon]
MMELNRISTGVSALDQMLEGGYEKDVISTIYGPAGSGKTNLCLLAMINAIKEGKKVIYIDTEGGFSLSRLQQISNDYKKMLDQVLLLKPMNFEEQKKVFDKLRAMSNEKIGMIIVDTISMLYRIERDKDNENSVVMTNRELGLQFSYLTEIARKKNIPILITTQVYSSFDDREKVNLVGGDIVKYGSKCLIEIQKTHKSKRVAILKKHRSLPEAKSVLLEIREDGIFGVE